MKSVLVIGMSKLGVHLSQKMSELGADVVAVDSDEKAVSEIAHLLTDVVIGDCTEESTIKSLGVDNFDICFVTVGNNFEYAVTITSLLCEYKAKYIVAQATGERGAKILKRVGAQDVFFADKLVADKLAMMYNADNIFDYLQVNEEYAIYEIPVLPAWVGNSLGNLDIRNRYHINIIAVKNSGKIIANIDNTYTFDEQDHIMVMGKSGDVYKILSKM